MLFTSPYNHRCTECRKDTKVIACFTSVPKETLIVMCKCDTCGHSYRVTFALIPMSYVEAITLDGGGIKPAPLPNI